LGRLAKPIYAVGNPHHRQCDQKEQVDYWGDAVLVSLQGGVAELSDSGANCSSFLSGFELDKWMGELGRH
jgi:hypothetical protein